LAEYENRRETAPAEGETSGGGGGQRPAGRGPYQRRDNRRPAKLCQFCLEKAKSIDYKDIALLRQCISERGRILTRRRTGTCAKHQRMVARAIKRARHLAMLPYTAVHVRVQST
jgi:small subunit ribosomal protein S18